ncbi:hypothetical protein N7520_000532 [Penicillium odoratum]|uniref:uncharacterized protein n=1 Tax=Penicillium odoratum TaxID=1167516 RepID=UPI0025495630|nr:uncharacterized protein N7520_000532 [Penicillium odoratum]KAJ5777286.1 hypothetical protein N7520_000532 [Penicillium odoratum]
MSDSESDDGSDGLFADLVLETDTEVNDSDDEDEEFKGFEDSQKSEESFSEGEEGKPIEIETETEAENEIENENENHASEDDQETTIKPEPAENIIKPEPVENITQDQDSDDELLIRISGDKSNLSAHNKLKILTRAVAWQIERHNQWAGDNLEWLGRKDLCSILDVRSAKDMQHGDRGSGNKGLNDTHCVYDREGYKWGRPAAELLAGARRKYKPDSWMFDGEARRLLIALENWYFHLGQEEKNDLIGDAFE